MLKITYTDAIETYNVVEGDIIGPLPNLGRSGIIDPTARWPHNMIVYEFDPNLRKHLINILIHSFPLCRLIIHC